MIEEIVPATVAAEEAFTDQPSVPLFPEEQTLIARAVPKRRAEFATARHCARKALRLLDVPAVPILPGARGAPQWPAGIVGSLTHCLGYRAAAVARSADVMTLGIDGEQHDALPDGVLDIVALDPEHAMLARLAETTPSVCWDRLLFSAKESVYKAWFPLTGRWLDFSEAEVTIDAATAAFTARLRVPGPIVLGREWREFAGRYVIRDRLVVTAIVVPALRKDD